jgi:hypothetical protein
VVGNLETEEKCISPKQFNEEFNDEIHCENSEPNVEKMYVCWKINYILKKKYLKILNIIITFKYCFILEKLK